MKTLLSQMFGVALGLLIVGQAPAVELLTSGDFETPGSGVGDVPGWNLEKFLTDSADPVNSAELTGGEDVELWLRAFAGGGPVGPAQGNFDNSDLPAGNVGGGDFLIWQRNYGLTGTATREQGDATGDMNVDGSDLNIWRANYGGNNPKFANARLSQTVPGAAGETYTFQGTSTFEDNYSGFVTTLDAESPYGAIASPTTTNFRMEFLDASNNVLDSTSLDLRTEQSFPGFPIVSTLPSAVAPAGTTNVRVVAEALNMAWNGNSTTEGQMQSAYFNDFSLTNATNPGTDLLTNGDLNFGIPDPLDFWDLSISPEGCCVSSETDPNGQLLRTDPQFGFANHTLGGSRGVWLSPFFGSHENFEEVPVSGVMSQTVQASAGAEYTFSGWTRFEQNYSGGVDTISSTGGTGTPGLLAGQPSPTRTEIVLEFLDLNGNVLDSSTIDVKAQREALCGGNANNTTCGPAGDGWVETTLQSTAPAGTVFARLTGQMIDGVYNADPQQSLFFDDFSLQGPDGSIVLFQTAVPEPTSVALALGLIVCGVTGLRRCWG